MTRRFTVTADAIAEMVTKLREETSGSYLVATTIDVDWCPCCGVNLRLRDENGDMFGKFVATPEVAKRLGLDLIRMAHFLADLSAFAGRSEAGPERSPRRRERGTAMSAEKIGGRWRFQCDSCPEAVSTNQVDFHDGLADAKAEGFIAFHRDGMWFHKCRDCKGQD